MLEMLIVLSVLAMGSYFYWTGRLKPVLIPVKAKRTYPVKPRKN